MPNYGLMKPFSCACASTAPTHTVTMCVTCYGFFAHLSQRAQNTHTLPYIVPVLLSKIKETDRSNLSHGYGLGFAQQITFSRCVPKKKTQNLTVRKFVERHNGIHRLGYVNGFNTNLKSWAHLGKHLKGMYPFLFLSQKHTSKLAKSTFTTHPSGIVPSQGRQTLPSVSVGLNCYPSNRPT